MKREFLQLAFEYERTKDCAAGMFLSEKLDGMRCYWDGGITLGLPKASVPWANLEKDERYVESQQATGLWSRYGNVIHAPPDWLGQLPRIPLDGELYGDMPRQELMSIIKQLEPDLADWSNVFYHCFDMPAYETVFADGLIDNTNYHKYFRGIPAWIESRLTPAKIDYLPKIATRFESTYFLLEKYLTGKTAIPHMQTQLSFATSKAEEQITEELDRVTSTGGEGLILRAPESVYTCERTRKLLKVKKLQDHEAIVIGYTTGRETDKGSKLLGMMGALIVELHYQFHSFGEPVKTIRLELSGFTDEERILSDPEWAMQNPNKECPPTIHNPKFPRGSQVTFQYRGMSNDGVPQEARYKRPYIAE